MRSLLVTAFALSADALDFVAVSPGNGAAYEGSLSGNGNSIGYTAANGDQWNAFIYNSSYDQSTIMITPAQVTSPHASDLSTARTGAKTRFSCPGDAHGEAQAGAPQLCWQPGMLRHEGGRHTKCYFRNRSVLVEAVDQDHG